MAKPVKCQKTRKNRHKTLSVLLDAENDTDIISWLGKQENRSEAVKTAIRAIDANGDVKNKLIVDFLSFVYSRADEYGGDDGWSMTDLIYLADEYGRGLTND